MKGKFITFEGVDGSGKTTQINEMASYLKEQRQSVYITREPGGTELAERIRDLLLDPNEQVAPMAELLLVFAARADHIEKVLKPKIDAGTWVICSRFTDATFAYQGFARGLDLKLIKNLAKTVHQDFNPDCSFILDIDVNDAAARRELRGDFVDRFEQEKISFMQLVRDGYQQISQENQGRCHLIDASLPIEKITQSVLMTIKKQYFS